MHQRKEKNWRGGGIWFTTLELIHNIYYVLSSRRAGFMCMTDQMSVILCNVSHSFLWQNLRKGLLKHSESDLCGLLLSHGAKPSPYVRK